jgi:hypothetical protein
VQIKGATAYKYMGRAVQMYAPIANALMLHRFLKMVLQKLRNSSGAEFIIVTA